MPTAFRKTFSQNMILNNLYFGCSLYSFFFTGVWVADGAERSYLLIEWCLEGRLVNIYKGVPSSTINIISPSFSARISVLSLQEKYLVQVSPTRLNTSWAENFVEPFWNPFRIDGVPIVLVQYLPAA